MFEVTIDCATFLRLTATSFGEYGMHFISPTGVRALQTADDVAACAVLETNEAAALMDFVSSARLDFPTTTPELIAWVTAQQGDFVLPPWFVEAAEALSKEHALQAVRAARVHLTAKVEGREGRQGDTALERYMARISTGDAHAELDVLEAVELAVHAVPDVVVTTTAGASRCSVKRTDDLAVEIDGVIKILERDGQRPTPMRVMAKLRALAGSEGSCVIDVTQDGGVIWCRTRTGEPERLDIKSLSKRLARYRAATNTSR